MRLLFCDYILLNDRNGCVFILILRLCFPTHRKHFVYSLSVGFDQLIWLQHESMLRGRS